MKIARKISKRFLQNNYRKEMWLNARKMLSRLRKVLDIKEAYLVGSFTTSKERPSDADFVVLIRTHGNKANARWSFDMVIAPDNKFGKIVLDDQLKWTEEKYGKGKCEFVRLI